MKRDEVLAIVLEHQDELKQLGVKSLDLFGSVTHDKARPEEKQATTFLPMFNYWLLQFPGNR